MLETIRRQGHYVPAAYDAILHAALGEVEAGIDALERALEENSGAVVFLRVEHLVDPLRGHPSSIDMTLEDLPPSAQAAFAARGSFTTVQLNKGEDWVRRNRSTVRRLAD